MSNLHIHIYFDSEETALSHRGQKSPSYYLSLRMSLQGSPENPFLRFLHCFLALGTENVRCQCTVLLIIIDLG